MPFLAEHYRVSLMPVRQAIQALLKEQVLLKQDNGRLRANPRKLAAKKSLKMEAPELPADPYKKVLHDVLIISLRGEAREMKIIPCAKRHAISYSQVHAILHRIASQGLMEHTPRKGWCVRPFKTSDLESYITVRESLELLALDLARDRLEPHKLTQLLELNGPMPQRDRIHIDNSLHRYWVEKSENRYIQDFFSRHQTFYDMLLSHAVLRRSHIVNSRESHRRILEAMLRRDWNSARAELTQDIRRLSPLLKQTVERLERQPYDVTRRRIMVTN